MTDTASAGPAESPVAALKNYLGPYETWNFGIGKPYAFPAYRKDDLRYLTALVEHAAPTEPPQAQNTANSSGCQYWLPTLWGRKEQVSLSFWPIVVENKLEREVSPETLGYDLQQAVQPEGIDKSRYRLAFPVASGSMHASLNGSPVEPDWSPDPLVSQNTQGKTINVLAVIDDGIPFAHQNFRAADGQRTRLEFCWLQSADKAADAGTGDSASVLFGKEYTRETIERLIKDHGDDEDALYTVAGASSTQFEQGAAINRLATHGAHIMDIAAGFDPRKSAAPPEETRLIAVQLPNTLAWDTSSFGKDMYMIAAIHYVLERAERIAEGYGVDGIRVVINFSYGFSAGSHDGQTELEAAINEIVSRRRELDRPTAIVIPSGNTFAQRLHGEVTSDDFQNDRFDVTWRTQPNDRTSNYLEVWFPAGFDPGDFTVELKGPFGKVFASMELKPDSQYEGGDPRNFQVVRRGSEASNPPIGLMCLDNHRTSGRWRVLIALAPSEPDDPKEPFAPAGDWQVTLKRGQGAAEDHPPIYYWVQRDVDLEAFRKGNRQSYLNDEAYALFDDQGKEAESDQTVSYVRRYGSLNGMATGRTTLIVSGCQPSAEAQWDIRQPIPSAYSSAGKIAAADAVGNVDCTAPADRSTVLPGKIGAGTRSGSYALVQGTSVAAPLVARRLAEAFATCSQEKIKQSEPENYISIISKVPIPEEDGEQDARLGKFFVL